ncbi:M15 family metallopeptidase [Pedobacter sp.]
MRALKKGMIGIDVRDWQIFLLGQKLFEGQTITTFGPKTEDATKALQRKAGFKGKDVDGEVGPKTLGYAMTLGYQPVNEDGSKLEVKPTAGDVTFTAAWPSKPTNLTPILTNAQRQQLFGAFKWVDKPLKGNPENVDIDDKWEKDNIVTVILPGLNRKVQWNKNCVYQLLGFFNELVEKDLIKLIKTFDGTYVTRYIRGSKVTLSSHCFASAFDINVAWNGLNVIPALKGKTGSVRDLVEIANKWGFYWGGHFSRKDGMHFEVCKIIKEE